MRTHTLLLLSACLVLGCGRSSGLAPVRGKITLNGRPLPNARISFQPIERGSVAPGVGSFAQADENGEYDLAPIDGKGRGALIGKNRVEISAPEGNPAAKPEDDRRRTIDKVPLRYNVQSELTFDVQPGENVKNWELKAP
jgi:hypothetical protein